MAAHHEVTEMIIIRISTATDLNNASSAKGKIWQDALKTVEQGPGFQRVYWGRQVEKPENVQLHIVRNTLQDHVDFEASPKYQQLIDQLRALAVPSTTPTVRRANISEFSPKCQSLGKGAPVTGTAIYLDVDSTWDAAWEKWVGIVQHVPGFMGIAGGRMIGPVDGHESAFIALVGWESVAVHDAYHHTRHFRDRMHILLDPAKAGFNYYGHIAFNKGSSAGTAAQAKM